MITTKSRRSIKNRRRLRIRPHVLGTMERPRLACYRSNTSIYVQLIDDTKGVTLVSKRMNGKNIETARIVGREIAVAAKKKGIDTVAFDRGGNRYHGVIAVLAETVREGGIRI